MAQQLLQQIGALILRHGLHAEVAARFVVINALLQIMGFSKLEIISGYRDQRKQEQLLANWNAGYEVYPVGMPASKPACNSQHTVTQAGLPAATGFDAAGDPRTQEMFARLWVVFQGARWGGWFDNPDPNHYDASQPFTTKHPIC